MAVIRYPEDLPISARRQEIIAALRGHQVVVIAGETGSGKTTQIPKMCLELGLDKQGRIGCTQPRRVAAMSVSKRVAEELQVPWGREVGCKMRFNDDTSRDTRLKFMTDGILLAEIQSDPLLRAYSTIILDEAHERSLNIDFLLGYLKGLLVKRPDLKLVITSATIDTAAFSAAFGNAPIIEVSGRLYPVEIRYAPLESLGDEDVDLNYVEAVVHVVEDTLIESDDGDILVFMPTERDIREARDVLEGRIGTGTEVLSLFGRMPAAEQQRIFSPGAKRRVVIATNVAETSLTIPRIRYVVDTGLARMSRYNPRTRTKRLPVEPVAQSSANQRAGRAGRLRDGTCIRLYSQEDFEKRPAFATPEIQRANLAEVILRMKAYRLGQIEEFPFINPPLPAAIRGGYDLLHELGAMQETQELTALGRDLARLPLDPTLGRMLLHAREEKVLPEMLVIAAGLSVPDPRERPEEAREKAASAHKAFAAPDSDFLALLKMWRAAPETESNASRNALRRFCKTNYLSLTRMREWRDIYRQLSDAMGERPGPLAPHQEGLDDALHRSILAGILGHIAQKQERNTYKASGNRLVTLFPGSHLYERREKKTPKPDKDDPPTAERGKEKPKQPAWIMAGEIVQTSQLFARTVARIDPAWILSVGAHLCRHQYSEPHWNQKSGRVLCWERTHVHGLEIRRQTIDYGKVDARGATDLFIRAVLLDPEAPLPQYPFHLQNLRLRQKLEAILLRSRSGRFHDFEEALFRYYAERLHGISSLHDLNRLIAERRRQEPNFLLATEAELTAGDDISHALEQFPDQVALGNTVLPVSYAYTPGQDEDGVTVQVPITVAEHLTTSQLQWMVPGLREEQISVLLRALPRRLRRDLQPLDQKIREVVADFDPGRSEFLDALACYLTRRYSVEVQAADWPPQSLPPHLQPRITVLDKQQKTVLTSRDLTAIQASVEQRRDTRSHAWEDAVKRNERHAIAGWTFGNLPVHIDIEEVGGVMLRGYPGLSLREGSVDIRLYRKPEDAARTTPAGLRRLGEMALTKDLAWLWKELRNLAPRRMASTKPASFQDALQAFSQKSAAAATAAADPFASAEELQEQATQHLVTHVFRFEPLFPLTEKRFQAMLEAARRELPGLAHRLRELIAQLYELHQRVSQSKHDYPGMREDLQRLLPHGFLLTTPHRQLLHVPRYLKGMLLRAERRAQSIAKDEDKSWHVEEFDHWKKDVPPDRHETFHWMLEEFRVQTFAPELGTAQTVSAKRLREMCEGS